MYTRLTLWLRSGKTTLANPMCECALVGTRGLSSASGCLAAAHPLTPATRSREVKCPYLRPHGWLVPW